MVDLKIEKTEDDIVTPEKDILKLLRTKNLPVPKDVFLAELEENYRWNISQATLDKYIEELSELGYDIKDIANEIVLVRYSTDSSEKYYRSLGKIETPCILSADQHVGSRTFTEMAWNQLVKDIEEYSVEDLLLGGDVFQGRGVHRMELEDVKILAISDQIDAVAKKLNMLPTGTKIHVIMGTHEEKIKGNIQVGLDVFKALGPKLKPGLKFRYYGHIAKLTLNGDFDFLMLHGDGGMPYAIGYAAQRIYRNLVEPPHVLYTGHLHQIYSIGLSGFRTFFMGGTMQRENSYLLSKGITSDVGYIVLQEYSRSKVVPIVRRPVTF